RGSKGEQVLKARQRLRQAEHLLGPAGGGRPGGGFVWMGMGGAENGGFWEASWGRYDRRTVQGRARDTAIETGGCCPPLLASVSSPSAARGRILLLSAGLAQFARCARQTNRRADLAIPNDRQPRPAG